MAQVAELVVNAARLFLGAAPPPLDPCRPASVRTVCARDLGPLGEQVEGADDPVPSPDAVVEEGAQARVDPRPVRGADQLAHQAKRRRRTSDIASERRKRGFTPDRRG